MRRFTIILITLGLTAPFAFADSDLEYDQLPDAVKQTVDKQVGKGKISDIDKESDDQGRTYYEIDYREGKTHMEMKVSEDGKVLMKKSC
jgi:hypothetical protein